MAPQRSSSTKAPRSKGSGGLKQGTLSFTSAKRSGSLSAKDNLKGKETAASVNPPAITLIRVGGKRKYEPDSEPEPERVEEATEVLERERLDTEDSRWNKAFGLARAKMGNIQPSSSFALVSYALQLIESVFPQFTRMISHQCITSCVFLTCTWSLSLLPNLLRRAYVHVV